MGRTSHPVLGMKIKVYALMYCGIQPTEINNMEIEDIELFNIYFEEMKKAERGVTKNARR